jgi:hypothetical protein
MIVEMNLAASLRMVAAQTRVVEEAESTREDEEEAVRKAEGIPEHKELSYAFSAVAEEELKKINVDLARLVEEKSALEASLVAARDTDAWDPKVAQEKVVAFVGALWHDGKLDERTLEKTVLAGQYVWAWQAVDWVVWEQDDESTQTESSVVYDPRMWQQIESQYLVWLVSGQNERLRFFEVDVGGEGKFYHYETVDLNRMRQCPSSRLSPAPPRVLQRLHISTLTTAQRADHEQRLQRETSEKEEAIVLKTRVVQQATPMRLSLDTLGLNGAGVELLSGTVPSPPQKQHLGTRHAMGYHEDQLMAFIQQLKK